MITRASNLATRILHDHENDAEVVGARVQTIRFPNAALHTQKLPKMNLMESGLSGFAFTLLVGCLIFGFASRTRMADFYLLPATYSGPLIEHLLMMHQGHALIRGSGHQLSVVLSILFCFIFWTIVFGAVIRYMDQRIRKMSRK